MSGPGRLTTDYFLTGMASQLAQNYGRLDRKFIGGRVFFTVDTGGQIDSRTLLMAEDRPRLFTGYLAPEGPDREQIPFLHLRLTIDQLAEFFTGKLDPSDPTNAGVDFEGNSEEFYQAVGRCL
jgi:hypothetical protein